MVIDPLSEIWAFAWYWSDNQPTNSEQPIQTTVQPEHTVRNLLGIDLLGIDLHIAHNTVFWFIPPTANFEQVTRSNKTDLKTEVVKVETHSDVPNFPFSSLALHECRKWHNI